jgi:hypothetical protein
LLLIAWILATGAQAWAIRAHPGEPHPAGGPVLGIETLVEPGREVTWSGPYGRSAKVTGNGRFDVWKDPYWTGAPAVSGRLEVDHPLGVGEAVCAAFASTPWAHSAAALVVSGAVLVSGDVWVAAAMALFVRLALALQPAWSFAGDPKKYHDLAVGMTRWNLPDSLWPPGWPTVLAGAYDLLGPHPEVGRVVGAVLGAALVPIAAHLAPGPDGSPITPKAATAVIVALSAELVAFSPSLYSEPLYLVLACGALAAYESPEGSGFLGALAALTQAPAVLIAPLATLAGRPPWRGMAVYAALFALPIAGWLAVATASGRPLSLGEGVGMNLYIGHRHGADGDWHDPGKAPAEGYTTAALTAIRADPGGAARRVAGNVVRLWTPSTSDPTMATRPLPLPLVPFGALVVLAVIGLWKHRPGPLIAWLVLTTATTAVFYVVVRYKLGLYPALLPLAGTGLAAWANMVDDKVRDLVSRKPAPLPVSPPAPPPG